MNILITGATGSFGNAFIRKYVEKYDKIIVYSRSEFLQYEMKQRLEAYKDKMRYFIGDVRDLSRLTLAMDGVDIVVHAAALKQVDTIEYNPLEAVKTNISGAENVISACFAAGVKKAVFLSTDKGVNPINLYGCTKGVSDALAINANVYGKTRFSVVRYGNVAGSRGSVIPFFRKQLSNGCKTLPVTHPEMTRFWISMNQAVAMVDDAIYNARGGETYITKIPSFRVLDLVTAMGARPAIVGIRPGEKMHEVMITEDMPNVYEYDNSYIIYPNNEYIENHIRDGWTCRHERFRYESGSNKDFMTVLEIQEMLEHL